MTSAAATMTPTAMPALAPVERPWDLCSTVAPVGRAVEEEDAVLVVVVAVAAPMQMPAPAVLVAQSRPKLQQWPPSDEGQP